MISKNGCDWFLWVLTCFDMKMEFFWKSDNERRTLSKMVFKADYLANPLWIALYYYIKMYEWLLGVEIDIYLNMIYFLLYLDHEKLYVSVELCEEVDVSECIYVNWIVNVVGDCIYVKWWWIIGEYTYAKWLVMMWWIVCVNICIESSHMFMHTWLMVTDVYIQIVRQVWNFTYDVFVASKMTTLRWFGTTCI